MTKPRTPILGFVVAGLVEAVGRAVSGVQPGDGVVASRGFDFGRHADDVTVAGRGALKPVIDTVLPFTQIVQPHRRVDGGHNVGSVVLTFGQDG